MYILTFINGNELPQQEAFLSFDAAKARFDKIGLGFMLYEQDDPDNVETLGIHQGNRLGKIAWKPGDASWRKAVYLNLVSLTI